MAWWKWAGLALLLLALLTAALAAVGAWRWQRATQLLVDRIEAVRTTPQAVRFDATRDLDGLPPPVRRWFRAALKDGAPIVTAATLRHRGEFNLSESGEQWRPFSSMQRVVMRRPGFVWDGRVSMLPGLALLRVHVHDAYVAGEGVLHPAVAGLVTLADLRGGGEIAQGELMRWLAEAAWYPSALLPSQGVRWEPIDDRSARAVLADGATRVSLDFHFGADAMIERVTAAARGRTVAGRVEPTPWEGRWFDVVERDGMRVPQRGEVAWLLPAALGGRKPYWRGTLTEARYEFN